MFTHVRQICVISALFSFIPSALGLKCYKCESWSSWKDCEKKRTEYTCPDEHNERCHKAIYHHKLHMRKTFTKFCAKEDDCIEGKHPICLAATTQNATCESYCCDHDLCNIGSYAITSGMLLAACALVSVAVLVSENNFSVFFRAE